MMKTEEICSVCVVWNIYDGSLGERVSRGLNGYVLMDMVHLEVVYDGI